LSDPSTFTRNSSHPCRAVSDGADAIEYGVGELPAASDAACPARYGNGVPPNPTRILRAVGERLDLQPEKVADYIAEVGNTSAASIPLTLALLREEGRLHAGQRVLGAAIGAGFTWGAGTITWEID